MLRVRNAWSRTRPFARLEFLTSRAAPLISPYFFRNFASRRTIPATQTISEPALFENIKEHFALLHYPDGKGPSDTDADLYHQTVAKLQQALEERHLSAITEYWSLLRQHKFHYFLAPLQLQKISKLIVVIWPTARQTHYWDENQTRALEELAIVSAAGCATSALKAVLTAYLNWSQPHAVLKLFSEYVELAKERGDLGGEGLTVVDREESYDALASTSALEVNGHHSGTIDIFLAAISAHAMLDSFEGAWQVLRDTNIRIMPTDVDRFLKPFSQDVPLQQKVREYTLKLGIARLITRSPSLVKHITNLAKSQSAERLENFYRAVIDGLSGRYPYLTVRPTPENDSRVPVTEIAWPAFLSAFLKCQRLDLAEKLWDDLHRLGVPVGVSLWTALFDGYDSIGFAKEASTGWELMLSQGVQPDALAYRAFLSVLFNTKRSDEAKTQFKNFQKDLQTGLVPPDPARVLSVYNTVLHGLLHNFLEGDASDLLRVMKTKEPRPDIVSYNTFLRHYGRRGDFKTLATYFRELASEGLLGDVFTFSTILSALLRVGRQDAPEMILKLMIKQGIEPNVATFSAIIDQQMREQDIMNLEAALRILRSMEQNPDVPPNEVTYTTILSGLYRGRWLKPHVAEEYRADIEQRMERRGVRPNKLTYQVLLRACLQYPEPEGLQNALRYYREMIRRKMFLSQEIWYILLRGLIDRKEWGVAAEVARDRMRMGPLPVGAVSGLVATIRRHVDLNL